MVKIRAILNARTMNVLSKEQGKSCIKSKLQFFLLTFSYSCTAMTRLRHEIRHCDVKIHFLFKTQNQLYMLIFSQFGEIAWQRLFNIVRILQTIALKVAEHSFGSF